MPPLSLNDLPDLCLLAIFKCFSLITLLRSIRLVNTRWSSLLPTELNRRRSLVIVDDRNCCLQHLQSYDRYQSDLIEHVKRDDELTPWALLPHIDLRNVVNRINRYQNDDLRHLHNQIPPEMFAALMNSLPRITSLTVVQRSFAIDLSAFDQVIHMINHWSNHLVTLTLSFNRELDRWLEAGNTIPVDYDEQMKVQIVKLFTSINRATSLKHLKLELDLYWDHITNLPPLTILSQLVHFYPGILFRNHLDRILLHNASGNEQLQIDTSFAYELKILLRIDREFCEKFVGVYVDNLLGVGSVADLNPIFRDMDNLCTRFSSLVHLSLKISKMPLTMLSKSLSRLTQLVHLTLGATNQFGIDHTDHIIVPVSSVRLITLKLSIKSHKSTEYLHLPDIFPNLQVLSLTNIIQFCSVCELDARDGHVDGFEQYAPELRQCALLARQPFRRCPNLHTIEIDANDSYFLSVGMRTRLITRDEL